jgi:hypothetical protein
VPPRGELVPWPEVAALYTEHFLHSHHYNLAGRDALLGPVIFSVKFLPSPRPSSRILLRLSYGCFHLRAEGLPPRCSLTLARLVCPALSLASLAPLLDPAASRLLASPRPTAELLPLLLGEEAPGPSCPALAAFGRILCTPEPRPRSASCEFSFVLGSCFASGKSDHAEAEADSEAGATCSSSEDWGSCLPSPGSPLPSLTGGQKCTKRANLEPGPDYLMRVPDYLMRVPAYLRPRNSYPPT